MKPKVLVVDDEPFSLDLLDGLLGEWLTFEYAGNGRDALAAVGLGKPEVVLMDVEMPGGMNGYQVCRVLKDSQATRNIPVIFISAHSKAEDRLRAYESGGDDYVSKPFTVEELRYKIELALHNQEKRNEWAEKARQATTAAMASIREAADAGLIVGFLNDVMRQSDLAEIAATALRTLQQLQIEGAVQLRDGRGHVSRNSPGACTPVEVGVLAKMANEARIVDLGQRSAFNYERATIIVYNMPTHAPALYGPLKDTGPKIAEALDVRMRSLALDGFAIERCNALSKLLERSGGVLREMETRFHAHRTQALHLMNRWVDEFERSIGTLGLSDKQKLILENLTRDAMRQAEAASSEAIESESIMHSLRVELEEFLAKVLPVTPDPGASQYKSVELF